MSKPHTAKDEATLSSRDSELKRKSHYLGPEATRKYIDEAFNNKLTEAIESVHADEGSVWWLNRGGEELVPVANTGPDADKMVLKYAQPLDRGIISLVLKSEDNLVDDDVQHNPDHEIALDETLGRFTKSMLVVPFYVFGVLKGVVTAVIMFNGDHRKFKMEDLEWLRYHTGVLSNQIEQRLMKSV